MPTDELSLRRVLRTAVDGQTTTPDLLGAVQQRARQHRRKQRTAAGGTLVAVVGVAVAAGALLAPGAGAPSRPSSAQTLGVPATAAPSTSALTTNPAVTAAPAGFTAADAPTFPLGAPPVGLVVTEDGVISPVGATGGYARQVIYSKYADKAASVAAKALGLGPTIIVTIATGTSAIGVFADADASPTTMVTVRGHRAYVIHDPNGVGVTWWEAPGFAIRVSASDTFGLPAAQAVAAAMGQR